VPDSKYLVTQAIDVLEFDNIHNLRSIRFLFELLRERVGSPICYSSLAEDLAIAPNTVKKYIEILEALYIIFRITPFSNNIARSLLKEPKIYFFDTGLVRGDKGVVFENCIATCLLKHVFAKIDNLAENYTLNYLQTKDKKEVDFALVHNNQIKQIIEVKYSDNSPGSGLRYFHEKYKMPAVQLVKNLKREKVAEGIEILDALNYLQQLYL